MGGGDDGGARPLILTAVLPEAVQAWLDGWREAYFPPERNVLAAHLTLFHALPGEGVDAVCAVLAEVAAATAPVEARADRILFLGRGVAVGVHAPGLVAVRAALSAEWAGTLTRQDEQGLRPHVTVCNKVTPERARAVEAELAAEFAPRAFVVGALALFEYAGGPWVPVRTFPLTG
jgi:2'-5' RNA ligase